MPLHQVTPTPIAALSATLDRDDPPPQTGDLLPPLWHWLFFLRLHKHSALGPDGHAKRGGFLPPVALPRRMWAGGRFTFQQPLRVGDPIQRVSRIVDVSSKEGRSGPLVLVLVRHEISNPLGSALSEEHDIVYRPMPAAGTPAPSAAPVDSVWERVLQPDDVLLFRYSALTFNGHRIHYDRRYVTEVEGYPGLVAHGPLLATLLPGVKKKSAGMSIFLVDLRQAGRGLTVQPILNMVNHETNELFFDDLEIPAENLIGEEGQASSISWTGSTPSAP